MEIRRIGAAGACRNLTTARVLQPVEVDEAMTTIINQQFAASIAGARPPAMPTRRSKSATSCSPTSDERDQGTTQSQGASRRLDRSEPVRLAPLIALTRDTFARVPVVAA